MPQRVSVAGRSYSPCSRDRGVAALLTAASWIIAKLPGEVVEREALVEAVAEARPLVIEISPIGVRIKPGDRLLVDLPADIAIRQVRRAGQWSRA